MTFHYQTIGFDQQRDLGSEQVDGIHLLRASGRCVQVDVPGGWLSIWLPLSGSLRLESFGTQWEIGSREFQIWRDGQLRCSTPLPCWWIGLAGPVRAWWQPMNAVAPQQDLGIFSQDGTASRELRRLLVHLLRRAHFAGPHSGIQPLLEALCATIIEQQQDLHRLLHRCSGRTLRRRHQTLSRLLRVQHLIRHHGEERLSLARLAYSVSYSRCHLIRLYREVFDETPSEYAARLRYQRAWQLVHDTAMPVCEITEVLGFESQSAFCRAFKNSFGMTATELRRNAARETARAA